MEIIFEIIRVTKMSLLDVLYRIMHKICGVWVIFAPLPLKDNKCGDPQVFFAFPKRLMIVHANKM